MRRAPILCVAVFGLLEACSASGPRRSSGIADGDLLTGDAFEWNVGDARVPLVSAEEAFGLDAEMRAFAAQFRGVPDPSVRLNRLLDAMRERGLFALNYANVVTHTAATTFHERQGNCLSFTMLFVGLARAAGLDATYELVDVPPTWSRDMSLVVVGNHVNALVKTRFDSDIVIDFNTTNFRGEYPTHRIDDAYAAALFYSNLGAEALVRQQYPESLRSLQEAARIHAEMPAPWVNLGVLYARNGLHDYAEAAYLRALEVDPGERSALVNLVGVYTALGRHDLAEEYRQRVRRYQGLNPFYHYALAQTAYDAGRFDDALESLRRAIRLKRDEPDFYSLQGLAQSAVGRAESAAASFQRAARYSTGSERARVDGPLQMASGRLDGQLQ